MNLEEDPATKLRQLLWLTVSVFLTAIIGAWLVSPVMAGEAIDY